MGSSTGYEHDYCNYYQTLGFCLEPEVCPHIHEFAQGYFSEGSDEGEEDNYDTILETDDAQTVELKKQKQQIQAQLFGSCECCHGKIKQCQGELCKQLGQGVCYCAIDMLHSAF